MHHSPRQAYVTLQHKQGTDLGLLARLLGHVNPTVTQNIYVAPFPEEIRRAGEKFNIDIVQKCGKNGASGQFAG